VKVIGGQLFPGYCGCQTKALTARQTSMQYCCNCVCWWI